MPFFELKRFWCTTKWRDFLRRNTKQFYVINTVFTSQMNIRKCYRGTNLLGGSFIRVFL
jgi:hypothetical protein